MLRRTPVSSRAVPFLVAALVAIALGSDAARAQTASPWKISTEKDQLSDQTSRFAVTTPKSSPARQGKSVTAALVIRCVAVFLNKPTEPEIMVVFTSLGWMWHIRSLHIRYRFDEGPVRDYKLKAAGRGAPRAIVLPKFSDQDPVADLVAAKRLRVEAELPGAGTTLLDFDVAGAGAADAVRAIACR